MAKIEVRMPNESAEYRVARNALLREEIELRRHLERVAARARSSRIRSGRVAQPARQ